MSAAVRAAFAQWEERIAPVFDTARKIRVVTVDSGRVVSETLEAMPGDSPGEKSSRLAELGIQILICGAISSPLRRLVAAYGIEVTPFVSGDLEEVIQAWLRGRLSQRAFAMPGCQGQGRKSRWGKAARGVVRRTSQGDSLGPRQACVCPRCGHREALERGVPCVERECPECGTAMRRQ